MSTSPTRLPCDATAPRRTLQQRYFSLPRDPTSSPGNCSQSTAAWDSSQPNLPAEHLPQPALLLFAFIKVERLRPRQHLFPHKGGERVPDAERVGVLRAIFFRDQLVSFPHLRWARSGVMRIRGDEVYPSVGEKIVCHPVR